MKYYSIIKVGYSHGIYGCSGEYFTCIYTSKKYGLSSFSFQGLYGVEERIGTAMEQKKYKQVWLASGYGLMKIKEIPKKLFLSEYEIIEQKTNKLKIELYA